MEHSHGGWLAAVDAWRRVPGQRPVRWRPPVGWSTVWSRPRARCCH